MKFKAVKLSLCGGIVTTIGAFIILLPAASASGVRKGLMLCGSVIIPSLFPFCVFALFCHKSGLLSAVSKILYPFSKFFFHMSGEQFCAFLMSFCAGYPVGWRILKELYEDKKISLQTARRMGLYCVNAGPAFIVSAIGDGILGDRIIGKYLLLSQATATVILAFFIERKQKPQKATAVYEKTRLCDAFVESTAEGAASIFGICGWVVLFSAFSQLICCGILPPAVTKSVILMTEVTAAASAANGNILLISTILSFCGLSVHCQIYSSAKNCAPKYEVFLMCRLAHAALSTAVTYLCLSLDGRTETVISNGISTVKANTSFTYSSATALLIMSVVLIASVNDRKNYKFM